jgi:uncharacterized membrane protein
LKEGKTDMEALKLIGILIVIVGFILKKDTIATVVIAGIVTGLVSGMSLIEVLEILGKSFISQRVATVFVLTLPVIGICERYGLKEKAVDLIGKVKNATAGKVITIYQIMRALGAAFSLRLSGHPQFVRPLINPMAQGAAIVKYGELDKETEDELKAYCAASDNYGNFYAQLCFIGAAGTLLIVSTLSEQGCDIDALQVAMCSIPIAVISIVVGAVNNHLLDRRLDRKYGKKQGGKA